MRLILLFGFILWVTAHSACRPQPLLFATGPYGTSYQQTGENITQILKQENNFNIQVISDSLRMDDSVWVPNSVNNCRMLAQGAVDLAISQNDVIFPPSRESAEPTIRSIMPLYSNIFFLIYDRDLQPRSLPDLVSGRLVSMGPRNSGTARFTKTLFREFGIDTTEYSPHYTDFHANQLNDSIKVCCALTGFSNPRIQEMLRGRGRLFSLGDYQLVGKGSTIDGFCRKMPTAKPYIIPRHLYADTPQDPILTAAVDAVLLTHKDMNAHTVYHIIQSLTETKQFFAVQNNDMLLSEINADFSPARMLFPLHPGALQYIYRNRPSFLERYAEVLALVFSIMIAFVGAARAVTNWRSHQKKDRIDVYYAEVLAIQKQARRCQSPDLCRTFVNQLLDIREQAFQQLIDERLSADESFRIFVQLLNDTKQELLNAAGESQDEETQPTRQKSDMPNRRRKSKIDVLKRLLFRYRG